jgi:hypothetical protein
MSDRAAEYRNRADECRRRAVDAADGALQREYLALAETWLRLALEVERQHALNRRRGSSEGEHGPALN